MFNTFANVFSQEQQVALELLKAKLGNSFVNVYPYFDSESNLESMLLRQESNGQKKYFWFHFSDNTFVPGRSAKPADGYTLFGQELLTKHTNAKVIICEGEKCTEALYDLFHQKDLLERFIPLTSGGASSASSANWSPLVGRNVLVWPDNDDPGARYAQDVVGMVSGIANSIELLDPLMLQLPPKGDAVDWISANTETPIDAMLSALEEATIAPVVQQSESVDQYAQDPLPLYRESQVHCIFPTSALGPLAPVAIAISETVQAPIEICANALLAATSLATQSRVNVLVDGREIPTSIFALTIAASGERKSAVDKLVTAPILDHQLTKYDQYTNEMRAYADEIRRLPKNSPAPEPPRDPTQLIHDFTLDAMVRGLIKGHPSQGLFQSEAASFLGGYAMQKEVLLRTSGTLAALWSGEMLSQQRVKERFLGVNRRLTIHLQGQREVVEEFVNNDKLKSQGLLQRFLFAEPTSMIGTRLHRPRNIRTNSDYLEYQDKISSLLSAPMQVGPGGHPAFRTIELSDDAYAFWISVHDDIEQRSAPDGELYEFRAYAAKLAEQILRLAAVMSNYDDHEAESISLACMENAVELADYYLAQALNILGGGATPQLKQAEELLIWMKTQSSPIALREIYRFGPQFVRSAASARTYLEILESHRWISRCNTPIRTRDGKLSKENFVVRFFGK